MYSHDALHRIIPPRRDSPTRAEDDKMPVYPGRGRWAKVSKEFPDPAHQPGYTWREREPEVESEWDKQSRESFGQTITDVFLLPPLPPNSLRIL